MTKLPGPSGRSKTKTQKRKNREATTLTVGVSSIVNIASPQMVLMNVRNSNVQPLAPREITVNASLTTRLVVGGRVFKAIRFLQVVEGKLDAQQCISFRGFLV